MKTVSFYYWTDIMRCHYGENVGGFTSIELDDNDALIFEKAIKPAIKSGDMLNYFWKKLDPALSDAISTAIIEDFKRVMARDVIAMEGRDVFSSKMTDKEYQSLSEDELVERLVAETEYDDEIDYAIVDIKIQK